MKSLVLISVVALVYLLAAGFVNAETVICSNPWGQAHQFNIAAQSAGGIDIIFSLHSYTLEEMTVGNSLMYVAGVPGVFLPGDPGTPNLARSARYVAIPQGSEVRATIVSSRVDSRSGIEIAPSPELPLESDDSPLTYVKDMAIYGKDAFYPESPVLISSPRKIRGVDVVIVSICPFQYNPVTGELLIYRDLRLRLDFIGGNGHFGDDRLRSRFWEPILQEHLINYSSLEPIDFYSPERTTLINDYEYIIIVPNDAVFEAWGDTIKSWRRKQGIPTEVFTLSEVGGSDSASIKNFLQNAYNTWNPAPAAFLILSDYPSSGLVYGITSAHVTHPDGQMIADNWYADFDGDTLPELHHARICAQNNAQLSTIINKFLSYERNPYTDAGFYNQPLVCAAWQTDRWFQLCGEVIRGFLINGLGKSPNRQYQIYSGTPVVGGVWSTATNTRTVVQYWYARGWLSDTLNQNNAAWWSNGTNTAITNGINSGAFLVQHRDHGSIDGWGEPSYDTLDLNNLTNTMYPFVYSTNCQTGWYDYSARCFTEKFLRISNGALGVNSPTRNSYSFVNDVYIWGTYDCLWPQFDNGYPLIDMVGYPNLRPCLAMTSGKYYLNVHNWPSNPNRKAVTYNLYHHHGDAFSIIYSRTPLTMSVTHPSYIVAGQTAVSVTAPDSAIVALTVNDVIIGVAEATGSPANIAIAPQVAGSNVLITVTKANYRRYTATIPVVAPQLTQVYSRSAGMSADYTSISAYRDTAICFFDYYGSRIYVIYAISYNGGNFWLWGTPADTSVMSESPDVTTRGGAGIGVVYRYYSSPRQLRYNWRNYPSGAWSPYQEVADYQPYYNKPAIEYLTQGNYGVVYLSWTAPVVRGAYYDHLNMGGICSYLPGDINGDGVRLGGDVTYGVRYFKGMGAQPPDSCYMDSTNSYIYVAGDVNGNCEFRGSDITRLVQYFKGMASLSYCHFFPPPLLRESRSTEMEREE